MRWSKAASLAAAPPIEEWPEFHYSGSSKEDQEYIQHREMAVRMLVAGKTYEEIKRATGLHHNVVRKITAVCLSLAPDGRIYGFRGLLPFTRMSSNVRKSPVLPKRTDQKGGMSCSLQHTLARFPDLERRLVNEINKKAKLANIPEYRVRPVDLHRVFIDELKKRGVKENEWPFTTRHLGRRSVVEFMRDKLSANFDAAVRVRGNSDAKAHLATGSGHLSIIPFAEPFDAVEIDAYHIDALFSVAFKTLDGAEIEAVMNRLWLIAAVERTSTAVLAYRVVYRTEVTASDVGAVIRDAICKTWTPRPLTIEGLAFPPSGGFPSGVIPEANGAVWSVTMFDGALAHMASLIHDNIRKATGFAINWGAPGHFERRPNVEMLFKRISQNLFFRLPSTTGSNPKKGRAEDAAEAAKKYKIRADEINQMVEVMFAEYNGLPGEGNFYNSPLDTLRYFLSGPSPRTMIRQLPFKGTARARALQRRVRCKVRGGVSSGRRPYIQFENVRYTSPILGHSSKLLNTELIVEVNDDDLRTVKAFTQQGLEIGLLSAHGKWRLTKHDLATRKAIFKLAHRRIIVLTEIEDPIQVYLRHLANEVEKSKKGNAVAPKDATNLARVAKHAEVEPTLRSTANGASPRPVDEPISRPNLLLVAPSGRRYKVKNR